MSPARTTHDFDSSEPPTGPNLMDAWSSGRRELGGYELIRPVGSGGMGTVFEALDDKTGRRVALKTLHRTDPEGIIALKLEFRRMADVVHPNLALLHELVQDGELFYFAMEFVDGLDFYRYVTGGAAASAPTLLAGAAGPSGPDARAAEPHRFREERLRNSLIQLASGVKALHQERLLHLDLKPANVLVESDGRVVILDFGLVRPESVHPDMLFVGTPAYMAPEQAEGRAGPPADAYAMGVMLFEALTGDLPFDVRGHAGILGKLRNDAPRASARRPDTPRDLDELCADLLARDPGKRPSIEEVVQRLMPSSTVRIQPRAERPGLAQHARSELVGRERELSLLLAAFERCRRGEAGQVYVEGPSGVGKTALVQRFAERATRAEGTLVLEARCYERESIPYKAVDALIDSLAPHLAERLHAAGSDLNDVLRAFPALGPPDSARQLPARPLAGDPHEARRRAFRGLRALLADLAREHALVLVIDDLQWGDLDSARLLVELFAPPHPPALLFVGTYRSEERAQSPFLGELLGRHPGGEPALVRLEPLSLGEAEALALELLCRDDEGARRVARLVAEESGGNPLLVDSLVRYRALDDGAEPRRTTSVESLVQAALERLPEQARRLLEMLAVAGQPVPQGLVLGAAGVGSERHPVLAQLRNLHLIRTRGTTESDPVDVYHDRIREVLYAELPRLALRSLHQHLATALEPLGDEYADLLARQFDAAGQVDKAGHYALVSAERAARALAFEQAAELYTLAARCRPGDLDLQVRRAEALVQAGQSAEAARAFLACARTAPESRALVLERHAARQLLFAGHVDEGIDLFRPVLAHHRLALPRTTLALTLALAWGRLRALLRGTGFELAQPDTVAPALLARIDTAISAADGLSSIDPPRAGSVLLDALHLALRAGERSRIAWTLGQYGLVQSALGTERSIARGQELLARAENLARGLDDPNLEGALKLAWSQEALLTGDFRAALARADTCSDHLRSRCASASGPISVAMHVGFTALESLGQFGELARRAETGLALATTLGDRYASVTSLAYITLARLAAGDPDGAHVALREARRAWSARGFLVQHWLMLRAEAAIALYEGESERALTLVNGAWPALRASRLLSVQFIRACARRLRGGSALACLSESRGSPRRLLAQARADAAYLQRQPQAFARGSAAALRAGIACFEGHLERALPELGRAIDAYDAAGMAVEASSVRLRRALLSAEHAADAEPAKQSLRDHGVNDPETYARLHAR